MKRTKINSGVTLTVLVIVIIVLIILAGASLGIALGDDGILNKGVDSSRMVSVQKVAEDARMAYRDVYEEKEEIENIGAVVTTADVANKMINSYRL